MPLWEPWEALQGPRREGKGNAPGQSYQGVTGAEKDRERVMSKTYDKLVAIGADLETVPRWGQVVSVDEPPGVEDPDEQIYLEPVVEQNTENNMTIVTSTWTAIVIATPSLMLQDAMDAQAKMVQALLNGDSCVFNIAPVSLPAREQGAKRMGVSISAEFTIDQEES